MPLKTQLNNSKKLGKQEQKGWKIQSKMFHFFKLFKFFKLLNFNILSHLCKRLDLRANFHFFSLRMR